MNAGSANGGETNEAEGVGAEARTVFVRNLPYTLSDSQLQEVFSEIGPVRRSFTIKEKGTEQHRGFGYVQFATVDDALRAVKEKDGTILQGRKVMVKLAKRRPSLEQRRMKREPDKQPNKDRGESLDPSGLDGKAPRTPLIVAAKSEKQPEPIQSESNKRGKVAQGKQIPQHGSRTMQEPWSSLDPTLAEELKSLTEIDKRELSESNSTKNGDAVHTKDKRKRQHDIAEPGGKKKQKKKEKSDSCQNSLKDEVMEGKESSEKQRVARTVILGGLVSPEMREAVIERAKKVGSVESIQSSLSPQELKGRGLEKDGCKTGAAAIVFKSVKGASQAVVELHQKSIGNGIVWARQLGGEGSKPRKWRVIIRNLPFNITEEKIRELFSSLGFVWEAKVPRKEDGQARGFAFASFTSKANAEKAIQDMNGRVVQKRPIAVDWAVQKKAYQPGTTIHSDDKEKLPSDIEEDETASEDEEVVLAKQDNPFEKFENGRAESELLAVSEEVDLAKRVFNKVVSASNYIKSENIDSNQTVGDGRESLTPEQSKWSQSERKTAANEDQSVQCTSQGDLTKTIFIKNLPFDVDQASLKKVFSTFGKVKSTYLVRHPKTKRPKGTAFLEFLSTESAEAAFGAASGLIVNNQFAAGISLGGRKLEVLKALEKKSAAALEKEKLEKIVTDRRNLYLLKEGKIEGGSTAVIGVSEQDMQKRRELDQVKKVKLKSPNFHVSKMRLAIHNVPKSLKELELKKLFIEAVKSRATKQQPVIKEARILRDDAKSEKSRGVAFVEFTEHEHALVALRVLNNNPETFGPDRRPIVEFAIENLQMLRKRQERQATGKHDRSDSQGNARHSRPKDGEKKMKRQSQKNESINLEREKGGLNASEHSVLDSGVVGKSAKANLKKKEKVKMQHLAELSSKRKWHGTSSTQGTETTIKAPPSVPNFKRQKVSTKTNVKRKDLEDLKTEPFSGTSNAAKLDAKGLKRKMDKAESVVKAHNPKGSQQKIPKGAKKKKGSKSEVEDNLDKLVAAYREKYFSGKDKKKLTGVSASNDFKRWFE